MRPATWSTRSPTRRSKTVNCMAKTLLSMHDLRRRALAEIRQLPGCHNVQDIAINRVTNQRAENNWSLCVLSAGTADANTAARAALYVPHSLRHDHDLMTGLPHCAATVSPRACPPQRGDHQPHPPAHSPKCLRHIACFQA